MKLKVLNGPNLNMLGKRDTTIYGKETYEELISMIKTYCKEHNMDVECIQSNHEGVLVDEIQKAYFDNIDALIINPGAFTHYSYAIRDALEILNCPIIEVHLSDIYNREDFRKINVIKDVITHSVIGKGSNGYIEAINYLMSNHKQ